MRSLLTRIIAPVRRALEGSVQPRLPRSGGSLPPGTPINWWQHGYSLEGGGERGAVVEACISAYAQSVALCPPTHWRSLDNGGRQRVDNSALARVLKRPNDYQSISDFMLNLVRSLYLDGNAYALALRNERWEVTDLQLLDPRQCSPRIGRPTGDIFFQVGGNNVVQEPTCNVCIK